MTRPVVVQLGASPLPDGTDTGGEPDDVEAALPPHAAPIDTDTARPRLRIV
jgi:hypothetical protein